MLSLTSHRTRVQEARVDPTQIPAVAAAAIVLIVAVTTIIIVRIVIRDTRPADRALILSSTAGLIRAILRMK